METASPSSFRAPRDWKKYPAVKFVQRTGHHESFHPRPPSKMGMSHIPEDRHKHGLVLDYSIEQNMVPQRYWQPEFESFGFINQKPCANMPSA